ncbi:Ankyrin repeat protein 1 [Giardia muris]|uniref:Ankyrin repeat protein 1 n=1 Tax=Giardia muris TaxID=5742 RepID=A0A4Z1SY56_GIAMU|nr:Ankyrin repeat protein 1 [Giardia muris]|eukprot:TNJ30440.1 Ankyrin repeat protein 1 [Giardia muris]
MSDWFEAVRTGNVEALRALLHQHARSTTSGQSGLMLAAIAGNLGVVQLLLEKEAGMLNHEGYTALYLAALAGQAEVCEVLLTNKVECMAQDPNNILCAAVKSGSLPTLRMILDAFPFSRVPGVPSALDMAVRQRNPDLISLLLADSRIRPRDICAAFYYLRTDDEELRKMLWEALKTRGTSDQLVEQLSEEIIFLMQSLSPSMPTCVGRARLFELREVVRTAFDFVTQNLHLPEASTLPMFQANQERLKVLVPTLQGLIGTCLKHLEQILTDAPMENPEGDAESQLYHEVNCERYRLLHEVVMLRRTIDEKDKEILDLMAKQGGSGMSNELESMVAKVFNMIHEFRQKLAFLTTIGIAKDEVIDQLRAQIAELEVNRSSTIKMPILKDISGKDHQDQYVFDETHEFEKGRRSQSTNSTIEDKLGQLRERMEADGESLLQVHQQLEQSRIELARQTRTTQQNLVNLAKTLKVPYEGVSQDSLERTIVQSVSRLVMEYGKATDAVRVLKGQLLADRQEARQRIQGTDPKQAHPSDEATDCRLDDALNYSPPRFSRSISPNNQFHDSEVDALRNTVASLTRLVSTKDSRIKTLIESVTMLQNSIGEDGGPAVSLSASRVHGDTSINEPGVEGLQRERDSLRQELESLRRENEELRNANDTLRDSISKTKNILETSPILPESLARGSSQDRPSPLSLRSPLHAAVIRRDAEEVQRLLRDHARETDERGNTSLMIAARLGFDDLVVILLHYEARLQNRFGDTALMFAAVAGHFSVVELLAPVEATFQNESGLTALMLAAEAGNTEIVRLLVKYDETRLVNNSLETALILAATNDRPLAVSILVEYEAGHRCISADGLEGKGETALMRACFVGARECVEILHPWEKDIVDRDGRTALEYACEADIQQLFET